jgi:hypothetical protein
MPISPNRPWRRSRLLLILSPMGALAAGLLPALLGSAPAIFWVLIFLFVSFPPLWLIAVARIRHLRRTSPEQVARYPATRRNLLVALLLWLLSAAAILLALQRLAEFSSGAG